MLETALVVVIVCCAAVWTGTRLVRTTRGCGTGCRCSSEGGAAGPHSGLLHIQPPSGPREARGKRARTGKCGAALAAAFLGLAGLSFAADIPDNPTLGSDHGVGRAPDSRPDSTPWWLQEHPLAFAVERRSGGTGAVTLEGSIKAEVFSGQTRAASRSRATVNRSLIELGGVLDLEGVTGWRGTTVGLQLQHGQGSGLTQEVIGDLQTISNIDAHDFTQVAELWVEHRFEHRDLRVRVGKQDANADFAAAAGGDDFINSSFGLVPTVPLPTYPHPAVGLGITGDIGGPCSAGLGLFEGAPHASAAAVDGLLGGPGGRVALAQLTFTPEGSSSFLPGTYSLGLWHHSADVDELTGDRAERTFGSSHGAWMTIDQPLLETTRDARMNLFVQLGWAPSDRSEIGRYAGAGFTLAGAIPGRPQDVIGLGVAHAELSGRLRAIDGRIAETAVELFYKARILPWLAIQPDLQYLVSPGGHGPDAVAVGMRLETQL